MMKEPPDRSWVKMETIKDPGNPLVWLAFVATLIFGIGIIILLLA